MSIAVSLRHQAGAFTLDAAFHMPPTGVTALFGPSGAGKTTIVQAIAGLIQPQSGRVAIGERILLDTGAGLAVPAHDRRIGYVFQDARLFPHLTVERNLLFGWRRARPRADGDEIARVIALLGLAPLLARKPRGLSGGEKSRVALGRALLSRPALLLLDEPLSALDAARKAEILPYLERLRDSAGLPMLYVSHAAEEVLRLADHVVLLAGGRVTGEGSVFDFAAGDLDGAMVRATGAVFETRVAAQREDGLTVLSFDGGELLVSRLARAVGTALRVRIRAEDILLARLRPDGISANNILETRITAVRLSGCEADIHLRCGGTPLTARITQSSLARLSLREGERVFAIVKSVTVDARMKD